MATIRKFKVSEINSVKPFCSEIQLKRLNDAFVNGHDVTMQESQLKDAGTDFCLIQINGETLIEIKGY